MSDGLFARPDGAHPDGAHPDGAHPDGDEDAAAGVARRLQARLDRHVRLLDRLRSDPLLPDPPGMPELLDTARRMQRDAASLLMLCGHDPGAPPTGPRSLGAVLAEAAAATEEPWRVEVVGGSAVTVGSAESVEIVHVMAELVDHVVAAHPDGRVELTARVEPRGGVTIEVGTVGGGPPPDGHRPAAVAQRLARRSRSGIELRRPAGGPPLLGTGVVATVFCPPAAVTVEAPARSSRVIADPFLLPQGANGSHGAPAGGDRTGVHPDRDHPAGGFPDRSYPESDYRTGGYPDRGYPERGSTPYTPQASSPVDELFGPMLDLPSESVGDRSDTPIFEAIASAWFREGGPPDSTAPAASDQDRRYGGDALDWETPQDDEWRAAAERAARPDPVASTSTGLPRRRPGNQLVPPPLRGRPAQAVLPAERVPDRVRDRLSTYQRGLRQGRHRAPAVDEADSGT